MNKTKIFIPLLCILPLSCSSSQFRDTSLFFQGFPDSECKYLGYIESDNTGSSPNSGFDGAKEKLVKQALKNNANAVKIVNYNMAVTTFNLSAEMYFCPDTKNLKKISDSKFFNLEDTN